MSALIDIAWEKEIRWFRPTEWPKDDRGSVLNRMDASVIRELDRLREICVVPLMPSPVVAGHIRYDNTGSRHSLRGGSRLSDATDVFVLWSDPMAWWEVWVAAQRLRFGGIGVYFDTKLLGKPRVMFHFDMRDGRVLWARANQQYIYPARGPVERNRFLATLMVGMPSERIE